MFNNKKIRTFLRIILLIVLLVLFKLTSVDEFSNIEIYVFDFCIVFLVFVWTLVELLEYEGWKP
jgi:hypothetical protein